jgi:hypothetical protein
MHLLPGLSRRKIKTDMNESLNGRGRAPRSMILIFVLWLFGNSDLIYRKSQNFGYIDRNYLDMTIQLFFDNQ